MRINRNYQALPKNYLFAEIDARVTAFLKEYPGTELIRMGIGDVTRPLPPAITGALHAAVDEMGDAAAFRGYPPYEGYDFLRNAIASYYADFGVNIRPDEIVVSDGAKSDTGNLVDLFARENTVLICDPVYPVYLDTNLMDGRKIEILSATKENNFLPMPDGRDVDIIYLCSPNNPTGAVYSKEQLSVWVDYALEKHAVIIFDAAYEAFVSDPSLPRSIFAVDGARECAIECASFSKTAGFTGVRLSYTVVPDELKVPEDGREVSLRQMWVKRQSTKLNGVAYIIQRAGEAAFSAEGRVQLRRNLAHYKENAFVISQTMRKLGLYFTGGTHSPYIWFECPDHQNSWDFFDALLRQSHIVCTPGAGFGRCGEGFIRLTSFGGAQQTREAMERLKALLG